MKWSEQVAYIRRHMKNNRLRVWMTILATTMGAAFLIVLASIGFGLHESAQREILSNASVTEVKVWANQMEEDDILTVGALEGVHIFAQRSQVAVVDTVEMEGEEMGSELLLVDFQNEEQLDFRLEEGRYPTHEREVVVGYHFGALEEDDDRSQLLGKTVQYTLDGEEEEEHPLLEDEWTIVGIKEAPAREWAHDETVYVQDSYRSTMVQAYEVAYEAEEEEVRNEQIDRLFYNDYAIHAKSADVVKTLKEEIEALGYATYSVLDEIEQFDLFFTAFKIGLVFVGAIAVFIASIGIFNTMTMAVTERTREIGIMKALGMSPTLIQRLFLMESAWIGVVGTLIAIVLSYGISVAANIILPLIVEVAMGEEGLVEAGITFSAIPLSLIMIASAISITVAIISGVRPARKATKIDIIQAMRQEM